MLCSLIEYRIWRQYRQAAVIVNLTSNGDMSLIAALAFIQTKLSALLYFILTVASY
jgi:hypothetical protein